MNTIKIRTFHWLLFNGKEYDENELIKLAEKESGCLKNEDAEEESDIEFIKECLLQVNNHQYYNYIAIPNTWIGKPVALNKLKENG